MIDMEVDTPPCFDWLDVHGPHQSFLYVFFFPFSWADILFKLLECEENLAKYYMNTIYYNNITDYNNHWLHL